MDQPEKDRSSFLRKPSQILPDNSPLLRSCFRYKSCSSQRLSPHIKLHGHNWNDIRTSIWRSKSTFISQLNNSTQAPKLPEMMVQDFTPNISADDSDDETYLFQCSCAGLYQCSVTGLTPSELRSCFIKSISGPVLSSLLDKLLEKKVITHEADAMQSRSDRARFVIDTVRRKGEAASSQMIEFLRELDAFLHRNLFLI
uniref:CARD domain-containing protein n=1 Tax=Oreochromis aureus TaxID=47969 RepID=A0A668SH16_OREAU